MERGLASLPAPPGFRYRLENFDLIPVSGR